MIVKIDLGVDINNIVPEMSKITEEVIEIKESEVSQTIIEPIIVKETVKPSAITTQKTINVHGIFFRNETTVGVSLNIVYPNFLKINERQHQCIIEETDKTIVANIVMDPTKMTLPIPQDAIFKVILEHDSGCVTSFRTYNAVSQVINNFIVKHDELVKSIAAEKPKNNFVMIKYTNSFNNGKPNTFLGFKIKAAHGLVSFYKPMSAVKSGDIFLCNAEYDGTMSFSMVRRLQIIKIGQDRYSDTIDYVSEHGVAHKMVFIKDQHGNYAYIVCGSSRWSIVDAK